MLYCVLLAFFVFGSWAGAADLNLLGIFAVFGLGVGVTIAGAGAELAAVVPGGYRVKRAGMSEGRVSISSILLEWIELPRNGYDVFQIQFHCAHQAYTG